MARQHSIVEAMTKVIKSYEGSSLPTGHKRPLIYNLKFGLPCEKAWLLKVGNQGLDDRYIRLRSHRISNPVVSGLRQAHSITFSRPGFRD